MENVTVRMGGTERELVERLAEARGVSRSDAMRDSIRRGAREGLLRVALGRYRAGEVGVRGAAELAGVSIAEMLAEANRHDVLRQVDAAALRDEVDALR